ncbi:AMH_1a_G0038690.mRNA.1.CDS.1 [Saccharomyces cerevisiae]|nr:AMH_1a_G0038690.mRNA.1.CDS.1 [Saccharomyces cerevisiae]CAI6848261.1 AMH_1a_G0038690.mRNA.1.CDS.1 [Saccharomyces cerevisiae]
MKMTTAYHDYDLEEPLTSNARPLKNSVITIRIIKSFPFRNVKNVVLRDYDLADKTAKDLFGDVLSRIQNEGSLRPFRNVKYDTLKIYTHAHGSKTVNLVINFDHDNDWTLDLENDQKKLFEYVFEFRISIFHSFIGTENLLVMAVVTVTAMVAGMLNIVYVDERFVDNAFRIDIPPHHSLVKCQFPG